jgi:DNA-directed RNA polymerase subunit RPC12/RpoP
LCKNYEKNISENSNIDIINNSNRNIKNLEDNYLERLNPKLNLNNSECITRSFNNMVKYLCVRCGHESSQIGDLKKHLNKAKECIKKYDETDRAILLKMLNNGSEYLKYLDIVRPSINNSNQINITPDNSNSEITNNLDCNDKSIYKKFYNCMYCDRPHNNRQNRWKHEKKCPNKK